MLFSSYEFIFVYLPVTFCGFFLLSRFMGRKRASLWLGGASLFFYGWWKVNYVFLLLGSIAFNYCAGYFISKYNDRSAFAGRTRGALIAIVFQSNLDKIGNQKVLVERNS
jgi:alginate O-acetyltransferase complex protein AlgI